MANISKLLRIIEKLKKEEGALFERYPDEKSIDKVIDEFTTIITRRQDVEKPVNRLELIKLILDLKVLDLENVKKMYEVCGYPFNYKKTLGDYYDEALRIFVENNLFDGNLPDNYRYVYEINSIDIVDNYEKYEYVLKNIILTLYKMKFGKINGEEEHLLYNLAMLEDRFLDTDQNIKRLLYPNCKEMDAFRNYLLKYDEENQGTYAPEYQEIIHVILLTILDNFYEDRKTCKMFRRVISDVPRSVYKKMFMDKLFVTEMFSYNYFESFYKKVFLDDDYQEKEKALIDLFTIIFTNLKTINVPIEIPQTVAMKINYKFLGLEVKEMVNHFKKIKHEIDRRL